MKYHKCLADLEFLSACWNADITPRFLLFKLANRGLKRSSEAVRSRRMLLQVEIRNKQRLKERLRISIDNEESGFKSLVCRIYFIRYKTIIEDVIKHKQSQWYKTHQNKILNLRAHERVDKGLLDPESVITNLSDYVLSDIEKEALSKGLNFCILPPKLKSGSYLSNFELMYGELNLKLPFNGSGEEKLLFSYESGSMHLQKK